MILYFSVLDSVIFFHSLEIEYRGLKNNNNNNNNNNNTSNSNNNVRIQVSCAVRSYWAGTASVVSHYQHSPQTYFVGLRVHSVSIQL